MSDKPDSFVPYSQPIGKRVDSKFKDLTGQTFHHFTVIARTVNTPRGKSQWWCRCQCGKESAHRGDHLIAGKSKSCGCMVAELVSQAAKNGRNTGSLLSVWQGVRERLRDESVPSHAHYKAMGVKMCSRWWNSFSAFAEDMGPRPGNLTLDRINPHGHYSCGKCEQCKERGWPSNVRWATALQQARNRQDTVRVLDRGELRPLADVLDDMGLSELYPVIRKRIKLGWTLEDALKKPIRGYASPSNAPES